MAILMILSFAASMIAVPDANAQINTPTFPFVDALPNPTGVGQPVLINWGLLNYIPATDQHSGWNVTVRITYPNGKVENTTAKTWSTGNLGRKFTFMEPGNYTLECLYDGEFYGTGNSRRWMMPSTSENYTLQVIDGFWKANHPGHTLPDEYWTRPVDSQLREWYSIMGSWLATPNNAFAPWNDAPESAHILWSMPIGDANAGLTGGDNGQFAAQHGDAYEGKFVNSVIIEGVLYYNRESTTTTATTSSRLSSQMVVAVDLHTGEVLWEKNFDFGNGRISRGQILSFANQNNRGTFSYLWMIQGSNMWAINPRTGDVVYNMTGVPSTTLYYGPSGELLSYTVGYTTATGTLRVRQWNSTHVVSRNWPEAGGTGWQWGYQVHPANPAVSATNPGGTRSYDAAVYDRDYNITGFTANPGTTVIAAYPCDRIVVGSAVLRTGVTLTGISLDDEEGGYTLFRARHWPAPKIWEELADTESGTMQSTWVANSQDDYVAIFWTKENRVNYAFSLQTGRFLWETEPQNFADGWTDSPGAEKHIAYGRLYEASVSGIVYCYNVTTGQLIWTYEATDLYNESYHRENWWLIPVAISSGKIYIGHMAHSAQEPKPRGAPFFALDCETGELVWEINGAFRQTRWGGRAIMGDSMIVTMDTYDQQIYAIGKGPSRMTATAPNTGVTTGTAALISGTVMDISPGTQADKMQYRFANGVPAVSEESMSEWMLYVYKQFARPMDTTGVEVTVFAQQGDHVIDIGTTVSDANGRYSIAWTPPEGATGVFDIYAYFSGSPSYYGSFAKTEMAVSAAPAVVEPEPLPPFGWYILGAAIAIIITVLLVGLLNYKKK